MKRALIVDDSRSARVILSRMLESYGLQVESCESAEQAIEHLRHSRPDVIFMDHLMPGMDGFQAVQALKGNPATATIPVMMYTSQEGELYLSQARALGAIGVLPKTVRQADVSRVLYQLRLLPERREPKPPAAIQHASNDKTHADVIAPGPPGQFEAAVRAATAPLLKEHALEMRRLMLASLEAFARRIGNDAKASASTAPLPAQPAPVAAEIEAAPAPQPARWRVAAAIVGAALLPALVLALLQWRTLEQMRALTKTTADLAAIVQEQRSQLASLASPPVEPSLATATASLDLRPAGGSVDETQAVPYGEAPLAGARVERLRELLANLKASDFHGTLRILTYVGEFCLTGNGIEGYAIASDDVPLKRCDLVGNPFDDSLSAAQRQSLAFANLLASTRQDSAGRLTIQVLHEGRRPLVPYPAGDQRDTLTAGEWNRIAAQNNRVEFAAQPAGP